ncbi:MAG: DUF1178 family protein [Tranquillimonas sp.]|jgi:hypothetical protein
MIRYALKCPEGHAFDSWFQSAAAYDKLRGAGHVLCPSCGSAEIDKALMAPEVRPARQRSAAPLGEPASEAERKLAALRRKVEAESEYVGLSFAAEARAIHEGDAPERSIYGEAKAEDARRLIEDGVPVAPLPFRPANKSN